MGIFDFFSRNSMPPADNGLPKEIQKLAKVVGERLAQDYDRQDAIAQLSRLASSDAAAALLKRFEFTMSPGITDEAEKLSVVEGLKLCGENALPAIREHATKKAESIGWHLRALRSIVSEESELHEELLGLLDSFDADYVRNPEPKIQLLNALEELPRAEMLDSVEQFLTDTNENVRFHAVGAVAAANDPACIPAFLEGLEEEESLRVKNRVCMTIASRGWVIDDSLQERFIAVLPPDYRLGDNGSIQQR